MQPQREGYDEPEPTGHPGSTRAMYIVGWPVNRLPRSVQTKTTKTMNDSGRGWWVGYGEPGRRE